MFQFLNQSSCIPHVDLRNQGSSNCTDGISQDYIMDVQLEYQTARHYYDRFDQQMDITVQLGDTEIPTNISLFCDGKHVTTGIPPTTEATTEELSDIIVIGVALCLCCNAILINATVFMLRRRRRQALSGYGNY